MLIRELFSALKSSSTEAAKRTLCTLNMTSVLKAIFVDTYDKQVTYGVTLKSLPKLTQSGSQTVDSHYLTHFKPLLSKLSSRELSGNAAIEGIVTEIESYTPEDQEILLAVIDRNLKVGVTLKKFSEWVGGEQLTSKFEVALALDIRKAKHVDPYDGSYIANRKLDGCRCIGRVNCDTQTVEFISREGRTFHTLDVLKPDVLEMLKGQSGIWYTDGECCIVDEYGDEDFQAIMKEIRRKDYTILNPRYIIFDLLTDAEFTLKVPSRIFSDRLAFLQSLEVPPHISTLESQRISSKADFEEWRTRVKDGNWEGFMLRKDAPYKSGRSKDLLKVKEFEDNEYEVLDVITGTQVYAVPGKGNKTFDVVSALVIEHKGTKVQVGSGLRQAQRLEWLSHPERIIGKVITVKYFEETVSQDGSVSLRFPIFKGVVSQ